jgi:hypothetical protein
MRTPLRLVVALLVPLLLLAGCGDDEPEQSDSSSQPSTESSEPTDDATSEATEPTESATSDETDEPSHPPTVAESATPTTGDDCTLLPTADVTSAFGVEMSLIAAGAQTCIFNSADGEFGLTVNLTEIQIDQDKYVQGTRDGCEGRIRKVQAGDVAFTCIGPIGPQGYVFRDSYSWVLDVVAGGQAEALDLAAELLPAVIVS